MVVYQRRVQDSKTNIRKELYINDALQTIQDTDYGVFLNLTKDQAQQLTRYIPIRLWYFGRYLSGRYKVFFCNSVYVESFINDNNILLRKEDRSVVQFEQAFNYHILERKERLVKHSKTPYFENGTFNKPHNLSDRRFYVI